MAETLLAILPFSALLTFALGIFGPREMVCAEQKVTPLAPGDKEIFGERDDAWLLHDCCGVGRLCVISVYGGWPSQLQPHMLFAVSISLGVCQLLVMSNYRFALWREALSFAQRQPLNEPLNRMTVLHNEPMVCGVPAILWGGRLGVLALLLLIPVAWIRWYESFWHIASAGTAFVLFPIVQIFDIAIYRDLVLRIKGKYSHVDKCTIFVSVLLCAGGIPCSVLSTLALVLHMWTFVICEWMAVFLPFLYVLQWSPQNIWLLRKLQGSHAGLGGA